ncbi:MAG: hypothetical protein KKD18_05065 [Nanoarchaeota archaeon]|nr:hypothetical protein [Nanoarchaeota archaeon]MBU0977761.1 hypothetical protein [Nanoarchaeota archaeon]
MKPESEIQRKNPKKRAIYFISVLILTILITRGLVSIEDPDPIFMGFELHHFHYGIVLLIITNLAILFGKNHPRLYLNLSAISIGLIIDELVYIAGHIEGQVHYEATMKSAFVFALIILGIISIILYDVLGRMKGAPR